MFNKKIDEILLFHQNKLNCAINLLLKRNSLFELIYNLSEKKLEMLKNYINKNLKFNFIVCLKFSAEVSILFISKKNRTLRLYINYRELNIICIKNKYLILLIIEILNQLFKTKMFIKLDFQKIYNLI